MEVNTNSSDKDHELAPGDHLYHVVRFSCPTATTHLFVQLTPIRADQDPWLMFRDAAYGGSSGQAGRLEGCCDESASVRFDFTPSAPQSHGLAGRTTRKSTQWTLFQICRRPTTKVTVSMEARMSVPDRYCRNSGCQGLVSLFPLWTQERNNRVRMSGAGRLADVVRDAPNGRLSHKRMIGDPSREIADRSKRAPGSCSASARR